MKLAYGMRRRLGQEKERLAGRYLTSRGISVLQYNYQCRAGEIDLIARDGPRLLFIEVKFRSDSSRGEPQAFVTAQKQRRIIRCAQYLISRNPRLADRECRFDVIAILQQKPGGECRIDWIRDAFQLSLR